MLYTKDTPKGIDVQIQRAQSYLYDKLVLDFDCEVHAFGRVYRKDGKPMAYLGGGEYVNTLTDDRIKGLHFFFIEGDESEITSRSECLSNNDLDIIVIIDDIRKVKGGIQHYADEEINENIKKYLSYFFELKGIVKGEKALEGFDISGLNFIYPFYIFKVKAKIKDY